MSAESYRPTTTISEPGILGMPRVYSSQREVGAEYVAPVRGSTLGTIYGAAYQNHIILSAQVVPKGGKLISVIEHCPPGPWAQLLSTVPDRTLDAFLTSSQVVPTPSQTELEAAYLASFDPIDETKGILRTKIPRRRKTDGTFENGYPTQQTKSKGAPNLTPERFKRLVTKKETTTVETLSASSVSDIPTPADPTGDQSDIIHQKRNDFEYEKTIREEIIAESAEPLISPSNDDQLYVDRETIVAEGAPPDAGVGVVDSTVTALGNGKAVKKTKLAVTNYVNKESFTLGFAKKEKKVIGSATNLPARYKRMVRVKETKTTVDLPLGLGGGVPEPAIGGSIVEVIHQKVSEDKYQKVANEETLALDRTPIDQQIESKPGLRIISRITPGESPVNPATGNGSSTLVAENGTIRIYENEETIAVPVPLEHIGGKKSSRLFEETTHSRYSTNPTGTGSNYESSPIYVDNTQVIFRTDSKTIAEKGPVQYESVIADRLPSVLRSISIIPIARKDGRTDYAVFVDIDEGYEGSFPAIVTEFYTEDVSKLVTSWNPTIFKPRQISHKGITFSLSIGETLHSGFVLREIIGSSDPDYDAQVLERLFPATEPSQIPSGYVPFRMITEPFENGYIVRRIDIKYR